LSLVQQHFVAATTTASVPMETYSIRINMDKGRALIAKEAASKVVR
jgi:hypothetical protein